jgi:putative transposase
MEEVLYEEIKISDSQIIDAVKRVESGIGVPDICRELGVSSATF